MSFYKDYVYPSLVDMLGDPPPIRRIREQVIPLAEGIILEIGTGSGANFIHYDPARVKKLYALEPSPGMIQLAERQRYKTKLDIEYLDLPGERIPLADNAIDSVVSTFTLCTIPGMVIAVCRGLQAIRTVTYSNIIIRTRAAAGIKTHSIWSAPRGCESYTVNVSAWGCSIPSKQPEWITWGSPDECI